MFLKKSESKNWNNATENNGFENWDSFRIDSQKSVIEKDDYIYWIWFLSYKFGVLQIFF